MHDNTTKDKIIQTMYELVAQKGYDKTSIGQISDAIGIKKASVYYYFKSKEEIFLALVRALYANDGLAGSELFRADIGPAEYKEQLIAAGNDFIDAYFENSDLHKVYAEIDLQTTRIPALKEIAKTADQNLQQFFCRCIGHGIAAGALPQEFDVKLNAQVLYAVFIGLDEAILYDLPIEPKAVWREVISKLF